MFGLSASYPAKAFGTDGMIDPNSIKVGDKGSIMSTLTQTAKDVANWVKDWSIWDAQWAWEKAGSVAFWSAMKSALNTIAYDTATWIGSGGKGQKPMFITEGWGEYLTNVADNAAGTFIEEMAGKNFNLCNPDLQLRLRVGLGLVRVQRPTKPACTFTQMKNNWEAELAQGDFLNRVQTMFDPYGNDFIQVLTIHTGFMADIDAAREAGIKNRNETGGWLDVTGLISGDREAPPRWAETKLQFQQRVASQSFAKTTEDQFEDAINIFLNQLAVTLFNRMIEKLGGGHKTTSPYSGNYGLTGAPGLNDYYSADAGGIAAAKEKFRKLVEPDFNIRGDYNILGELSTCPKPTQAGPTNCIITNKFRKAIEDRMTVGEAMKQGYLAPGGVFGFTSDGLEPNYNEGHPYRSMVILRKFRILPVGWELAAQYIKDHPEGESLGGVGGTKNLENLVNCYAADDEYGAAADTRSWCVGLIDPNWVLKAPLNYCKREGPGPEFLTKMVVGQGEDSKLTVSRNDKYCADEQACIEEDYDGSCQSYGYCTEETRRWNFSSKTCNPVYNTCETFRGTGGNTASYLKNTLNFGNCSVDNAGCEDYCQAYDAVSGSFICTLTTGPKIHLDKDASKCDSEAEGCHEFIRTTPGLGSNLFSNASFEEAVTGLDQRCDGGAVNGNCSVHLGAAYGPVAVPVFLSSSFPLNGEAFTFSVYARGCGTGGTINIGSNVNWAGDHSSAPLVTSENWQSFKVSHVFIGGTQVMVSLEGISDPGGDSCRIDAVKVERGNAATAFSDYREGGLSYFKLIPNYLANECYVNPGVDYRLRIDAPALCDNFSRLCNPSEAGCKLFTAKDGLTVPARVSAEDYCPTECVGYDDYLQSETVFDNLKLSFFIPKSARRCGAASAGCDEFTNLDTLAEGGENKEYYTYLKQCVRPNDPGANCLNFYTWEGSSETGYQLRVHLFQANGAEPAVTSWDGAECNSFIYNLPPTNPAYNPDCREYYNQSGQLFYHLSTRTITCGEDCHPYRRTEQNIVRDPVTGADIGAAACAALDPEPTRIHYDAAAGECIYCRNGGVWRADHGACIYMALPGEGQKCSAAQAGCREYSGSTGSNVRVLFVSDFEGSTQGFSGVGGTTAINDSESLLVGGESLSVSGAVPAAITLNLGGLAQTGRSYSIRFIAKQGAGAGSPATQFNSVAFSNGTETALFSTDPVLSLALTPEWRLYELDLSNLDHAVNAAESLIIEANGNFYIDNIRLTEIVNRYYLIKNSWQTPGTCYNDVYGNPAGEYHNLGCAVYSDSEKLTYHLRHFSQLCDQSAVNCELAIDTHNSTVAGEEAWNDGGDGICDAADGEDCEIVPADSFVYAVSDPEKSCGVSGKGCDRLGLPSRFGGQVVYSELFLKNDPDEYDRILCDEDGVGCESWTTKDGPEYFKDPGNQTCEWKQGMGLGSGELSWAWYKKQVSRCDDGATLPAVVNGTIDVSSASGVLEPLENRICLADNDCGLTGIACAVDSDCGQYRACVEGECHYSCIPDTSDYLCTSAASPVKTVGTGGLGNIVRQPTVDTDGFWAGLCSADQAGCSEYIDPRSDFNVNEIYNGNFSQDVNIDGIADGWQPATGNQEIELDSNTLYILSVEDANNVTLTARDGAGNPIPVFYVLSDANNRFQTPVSMLNLASVAGERSSLEFFTEYGVDRVDTEIIVHVIDNGVNNGTQVKLNKAVVSYQLKRSLDKTDCNGVVDYKEGCVLFNERVVAGGTTADVNYTSLNFDADNSPDPASGNPLNCAIDNCDSNVILKVKPDRTCGQWLACRSYIKDRRGANVCFDTGLCDSLDDNGDCDNFLISEQTNQTYSGSADADLFADRTGYNKVGYVGGSEEADYFPLGAMEQEGEVVYVNNGNFEISGNNGYPIGWNLTASNLVWSPDFFKVIDNPVEAQNEGVGFPPEGNSFLKAGQGYGVESDLIEVMGGLYYIISAMIDTQNLSNRSAVVTIEQYDSDGMLLGSMVGLSLEYGHSWAFLNRRFRAQDGAQRVKLVLSTIGSGNYYVDDIKLRPGLFAQTDNWVPQTCRLYPENDSLSCDYIEDSGIRKKGFWGYCLEYDRYPGSENNCVMWWPVDRVKGDGVSDEDIYSGYSGKFPVYYCDNVRADFTLVEHREEKLLRTIRQRGLTFFGNILGVLLVGIPGSVFFPDEEELAGTANVCPAEDQGIQNGGYRIRTVVHTGGNPVRRTRTTYIYCTPLSADHVTGMWYRYNGNLVKFNGLDNGGWDETRDGVKIYDLGTEAAPFDPKNYNLTCQKVWQTVNATGQNKSWTARVNTGSPYEVAELDYGYDTDDTPFGSAVPPEPVNNPYEWDTSDEGGLQPLYMLGESTDAARAGSPYDCNGNQCEHLGLCDISGDVCYNVPVNRPTGVINYCPNDDTNPCYENWQQTFLTCPAGERCNEELFNVELTAIEPHQKLRRIFAQSYGVWEWQGTEGTCADNPATTCTYGGNQCPNGACQARCVMYRENGVYDMKVYNTDTNNVFVDYRDCVNGQVVTTDPCTNIRLEGLTAAQWTTANTCDSFVSVCGAGGATCVTEECCAICCGDGDSNGVDDCGEDCCTALVRQTCINYWTLPAPTGIAGETLCAETRNTCNSNADCAFYTGCEWDSCVGGDNIGGECNAAQTCLNDYCVLASTRAGRYTAIPTGTGELTFWNPATTTCKSAGGNDWARPVWNNHQCNGGDCFQCPGTTLGSEHCDWCGVKPQIGNIRVDDNTGDGSLPFVTIHGNGFVNLTFNSIVDADQLPLVMYAVDWGDNENTVVSGVEMRDRKNPENPHSLFHLYSYWDLRAKNAINRGAGQNMVYCGARNTLARNFNGTSSGYTCPSQSDCCVVRPSIKIKDNWGWCNNGTDGLPCPGGTVNGFQLYGDFDTDGFSNAWIVITES